MADLEQKARELWHALDRLFQLGESGQYHPSRDPGPQNNDYAAIAEALTAVATAARAEGRAEGLAEAKQACLDIAAPMYPQDAQPVLMCAASIAALAKAGEKGGAGG